jgi:hypothetical protein
MDDTMNPMDVMAESYNYLLVVLSAFIEVTGLVSPIDPHEWAGFKAGPGLFMKVRNISGQDILEFAFETTFTSPETGRTMAAPREHGAFRPASRRISLPSGASKPNPKPYQLPVTSGMPARYSFTVALVIFDDGTTWDPAKLEVSGALLMRLATEK